MRTVLTAITAFVSVVAAGTALPPVVAPESSNSWSFGLTTSAYFLPDDSDYLSPVITADRGLLHLEARWNYEDMETGSLWLGCNFSFGEKWVLDLTPMAGGVFGESRGIAPGYHLTLTRGSFELYSEGEYVFDADSSSDSFFYSWSELTWSPDGKFRVGLAGQRTRAYESDLDIQRGILFGYTRGDFDFSCTILNPDQDEPTLVFTAGVEF